MSSNAARLADVGQSVWYDNLHRDLIRGGGLRDLINHHGVRGVTSNPTIFEKAILSGGAYDQQLAGLRSATPEEAYWELVVEDIAGAADVLASTYETTQGSDGFVSVEVTPSLAHDATGTVEQAHQLWERVARPNVMIKVPATVAGVGAVEAALIGGLAAFGVPAAIGVPSVLLYRVLTCWLPVFVGWPIMRWLTAKDMI